MTSILVERQTTMHWFMFALYFIFYFVKLVSILFVFVFALFKASVEITGRLTLVCQCLHVRGHYDYQPGNTWLTKFLLQPHITGCLITHPESHHATNTSFTGISNLIMFVESTPSELKTIFILNFIHCLITI